MANKFTKINSKHADIINKFLKGDLNRDFSDADRKYNTLYLQTTIDCMALLEKMHQKEIKQLKTLIKSDGNE